MPNRTDNSRKTVFVQYTGKDKYHKIDSELGELVHNLEFDLSSLK
jgi:hypothetical protein